ncbi:MAG: aldo/keto reductase, partial [Erysipelotrichaceae bacterium]
NYECEKVFGRALALDPSIRSKIQIVSKTGINMKSNKRDYEIGHYDTRYDKIIASTKASIANMNCKYLDVLLIHREDPCIDPYEVARAFNDLTNDGLILGGGVSNFDPFKMDALNYAYDYKLVTNQIELNPTVFEHFDSGMIDYLCKYKIKPMIWCPLAAGKLFTSDFEPYVQVRKVLETIANKHQTKAEIVAFAWLMYHPMKAMPISGSSKLERLDNAIAALDLKLTHEEWYKIYLATNERELR